MLTFWSHLCQCHHSRYLELCKLHFRRNFYDNKLNDKRHFFKGREAFISISKKLSSWLSHLPNCLQHSYLRYFCNIKLACILQMFFIFWRFFSHFETECVQYQVFFQHKKIKKRRNTVKIDSTYYLLQNFLKRLKILLFRAVTILRKIRLYIQIWIVV